MALHDRFSIDNSMLFSLSSCWLRHIAMNENIDFSTHIRSFSSHCHPFGCDIPLHFFPFRNHWISWKKNSIGQFDFPYWISKRCLHNWLILSAYLLRIKLFHTLSICWMTKFELQIEFHQFFNYCFWQRCASLSSKGLPIYTDSSPNSMGTSSAAKQMM